MAEDRMIRASMRESEKVNGWPIPLRYFWTQLWGYCDSYGRGRRNARLVCAGTFPLDEEVTTQTVERWMVALEKAGVIRSYEVENKTYFECIGWDEHQSISYRKRTDIPDSSGQIPEFQKSSGKVRKVSHQGEGEGEVEREVEGGAPTPFCKKHPKGTDDPCRACGNARRAHDAALLTAKNKPTLVPPRALDTCPDHKGYPLPCDRCAETAVA